MSMDKRYTALCGLWCLDCIPSNKRFFTVVKELKGLLVGLQFEQYARLKSRSNAVFREYPHFVSVLEEIQKLECITPCTEGGCKPDCEVRECVLRKNFAGCWECDRNSDCELLKPLKSVHPNLGYHLALIRRNGPEKWFKKRKAHYAWQEEGCGA